MKWLWRIAATLVAMGPVAASGQTPIPVTVTGNEASGRIELPDGGGADLTISFEQVVGLNPAALDVTASIVNPHDLVFLDRLPAGGNVSVPAAFPVTLRIQPSEASALSFAGVVVVTLHTENLSFKTNSPLALYAGPADGPLQDVTRAVGMGSYRAGGSKGGFSDFMIVADLRAIDVIVTEKFNRAQGLLNDFGGFMPAAVLADLQARLDNARTLYTTGATLAAKAEIGAFADAVKTQSGGAIPDVWRAHDDRINVAGLLRAAADTLKFSLDKKATYS